MSDLPTLGRLFRDVLSKCEVSSGESVVIVSQSESRDGYVEGFTSAAETLGATVTSLTVPGFKIPMFPLGPPNPDGYGTVTAGEHIASDNALFELVTNTDVVIDVTASTLIHQHIRTQVIENGNRMLSVSSPPEVIERLFPRELSRSRVERVSELLRTAETMHVTSDAGTDFVATLGDEPLVREQYGYVDGPGQWDNLASGGFAAPYPSREEHEGRIVLDAGDAILPMNQYVNTKIEFEITDGRVTDIVGFGRLPELVCDYISLWNDEAAYRTSHFGIGVDERAVWSTLAFYSGHSRDVHGMDQRGAAGGFLWSTGPNPVLGRRTRSHLDFCMRNCTITLDGETIVEHGTLVDPIVDRE